MKRKRIQSIITYGLLTMSLLITALPLNFPSLEITKTAQAATKWPQGPDPSKLSCDSAIVMELSTGSILYKKKIHKQHYPASITKILTAMLTLENAPLSDTVTFSPEAVYGIERGSSTVFSEVGEKLTVEQCLYAIMLESANEVCLGVAEHVSGSVKNFVNLMNQRVKELGLKNTHFNNPNGLPDPKHYTTAYDMAVIARQAMKNSAFQKVANTKRYVMPKTNKHKMVRYWNNHHQMINGYNFPEYEYKYCIGGKTGYTKVAHSTLVTFAEKDGMQLVSVIMYAQTPKQGVPNEYTDSTKLLNFGFEKYKKYTLDEKSSTINESLFNNYGTYFNTANSPVRLDSESSVVLPKGAKLSEAKQTITYDKNVKLQPGDNVIGHVTYTYRNRNVGSTGIIYRKEEDDSANHLDAASRKIVTQEINSIEEKEKKQSNQLHFLNKVKKKLIQFFEIKAVQIAVLVLLGILIIFLTVCLFKNIHIPMPSFRRRRRVSGGYSSRGARRNYARRERANRAIQRSNSQKNVRRNHSKHYDKKASPSAKKASKNARHRKRHKNTRESFGRNFFDF